MVGSQQAIMEGGRVEGRERRQEREERVWPPFILVCICFVCLICDVRVQSDILCVSMQVPATER